MRRARPAAASTTPSSASTSSASVYEGLLSYKGMWAEEDLLQVKRAKDSPKETFEHGKKPSWFVPVERRDEFKKDEIERLPNGSPRIYRKGTFILHLSGIDREKSASYYTPEVLTKCLVEEALRELLKDYGPEDADKILELTICEPAMGSASFLNEATEQLAERYLELKQEQLGRAHRTLPLPGRAAPCQALHRHPQRLRRRPQPHCRRAGRTVAVARLHAPAAGQGG